MSLIDVTVHYLEMNSPPDDDVPSPSDGLVILPVARPAIPYYQFLYDSVGRDYDWMGRRMLREEELSAALHDPRTEFRVLHVEGNPAGFAELDCHDAEVVELFQFGLMAGYLGQGLGTWFLRQIIDEVWSWQPQRFWLHTCSLDHPSALHTYQKAGFREYRTEVIKRAAPGTQNPLW